MGEQPDWTVIGGGIATALTIVGAIWAGMTGKFKQQKDEQDELRSKRDRDNTENTTITLENTWKLVNEVQQERKELKEELKDLKETVVVSESRCTGRITTLETEVRVLKRTIANLEADLRALRPR